MIFKVSFEKGERTFFCVPGFSIDQVDLVPRMQ